MQKPSKAKPAAKKPAPKKGKAAKNLAKDMSYARQTTDRANP